MDGPLGYLIICVCCSASAQTALEGAVNTSPRTKQTPDTTGAFRLVNAACIAGNSDPCMVRFMQS